MRQMAERVQQAWTYLLDGELRVADLASSSLFLSAAVNTSENLVDPPAQLHTDKPGSAGAEARPDVETDPVCKTAPREAEEFRSRRAPSFQRLYQEANTIEIVKRNGAYTVVFDGVAEPPVPQSENDESVYYWMPRFREGRARTDLGDGDRLVRPVLFALRLEDFESAPLACEVSVMQRVVGDGSVHMEERQIKTLEIVPYRASEETCQVEVLPYPIISTPEPYFVLNDFSNVADVEVALGLASLSSAESRQIRQKVAELKRVANGEEPLSETANNAIQVVEFIRRILGSGYVGPALAAGAAALVDEQIPVLGTEAAATVGLAAYYRFARPFVLNTIDYVTSFLQGGDNVTEERREQLRAMLAAALESGPRASHRVTMQELSNIIYRIAETRSNGTFLRGSEANVGMSVSDMKGKKWAKDAAFLDWMQSGKNGRKGQNPVTGLYSTLSNADHAALWKSQPKEAPLTTNTIGVGGMDPVTHCNTRAEFSFVISITNADGSSGPRIVVNPTRVNGIDAGWISAGYERQFHECNQAVQCLRTRLTALPTASTSAGSTLVSDASEDRVLATKLTEQQRAYIDREIEDADGFTTDAAKLKRRAEKASKDADKSQKALQAARKRLSRLRERSRTMKKLQSVYARNEERAQRAGGDGGPEEDERIEAKKTVENRLRILDEQLRTSESTVEKLQRDSNTQRRLANQASQLADTDRVQVPVVLDYEEVVERIQTLIIGREVAYDFEESDDVIDEIRQEQLDAEASKTWWQWWTSETRDGNEQAHFERSKTSLAGSLGLLPSKLPTESTLVARFVHTFCPLSWGGRRPDRMRFVAFVVPDANLAAWSFDATHVARVMPQIMKFSRTLLPRVGTVTILSPRYLTDTLMIDSENLDLSKKAIEQSLVAYSNISRQLNLRETLVYDGSCHFHQLYQQKKRGATRPGRIVDRRARVEDLIGMALLPANRVVLDVFEVEAHGDGLLRTMRQEASSGSPSGLTKLLQEVGIGNSVLAHVALASFAEVVAHFVIERGTKAVPLDTVALSRAELVQSATQRARDTCTKIGSFLADAYGSATSQNRRLLPEDVAFVCIPGFAHLKPALRRVGALRRSETPRRRVEETCYSLGRLLTRVAQSKRAPLTALPFTCLQTSLDTLPPAVLDARSYASPMEAAVEAAALAFERCVLICGHIGTDNDRRACVLLDCANMRPMARKAFDADPSWAANVAANALTGPPQQGWQPPTRVLGPEHVLQLRARMARLRIDVTDRFKRGQALDERSFGDERNTADVYDSLVREMTRMNVKTFVTVDGGVADFAVPFGAAWGARPDDAAHAQFENRPVWVDHLRRAAQQLMSALPDTTPDRVVAVIAAQRTEAGCDVHPFMLRASAGRVRARLYNLAESALPGALRTVEGESRLSGLDMATLESACKQLRALESEVIGVASGALSEHYRVFMHNAERLFQAGMAIASGVADKGTPQSMPAQFGVLDLMPEAHAPSTSTAVCVGSALVASEVGGAVRLHLRGADADALSRVVDACDALTNRGIKAVPFCEACACLSVIK